MQWRHNSNLGVVFPEPDSTGGLEAKLRHGMEPLTRGERLCAASIIAAYRAIACAVRRTGRARTAFQALRFGRLVGQARTDA